MGRWVAVFMALLATVAFVRAEKAKMVKHDHLTNSKGKVKPEVCKMVKHDHLTAYGLKKCQ